MAERETPDTGLPAFTEARHLLETVRELEKLCRQATMTAALIALAVFVFCCFVPAEIGWCPIFLLPWYGMVSLVPAWLDWLTRRRIPIASLEAASGDPVAVSALLRLLYGGKGRRPDRRIFSLGYNDKVIEALTRTLNSLPRALLSQLSDADIALMTRCLMESDEPLLKAAMAALQECGGRAPGDVLRSVHVTLRAHGSRPPRAMRPALMECVRNLETLAREQPVGQLLIPAGANHEDLGLLRAGAPVPSDEYLLRPP